MPTCTHDWDYSTRTCRTCGVSIERDRETKMEQAKAERAMRVFIKEDGDVEWTPVAGLRYVDLDAFTGGPVIEAFTFAECDDAEPEEPPLALPERLELAKLRVRCARLESALAFYAAPESHEKRDQTRIKRTADGQLTRCGFWSPIDEDAGQRARQALENAD